MEAEALLRAGPVDDARFDQLIHGINRLLMKNELDLGPNDRASVEEFVQATRSFTEDVHRDAPGALKRQVATTGEMAPITGTILRSYGRYQRARERLLLEFRGAEDAGVQP
jgi:hypothetical protein